MPDYLLHGILAPLWNTWVQAIGWIAPWAWPILVALAIVIPVAFWKELRQ